jgi:hypothetical protein
MTVRPEKSWVSTLFAPPILRVTRAEYQRLLNEPALRQQLTPLYVLVVVPRARTLLARRLGACRRAWVRGGGWRPYERWRRFTWTDEDELTIIWPEEATDEA